ncbi:MAG: 4-(cytidine 5-diphospho)-2-C-methyl-D-erythritol kinase [Sphingomonadales bacterium]|nr:4-(cytidine 5-diphospho)-2-C-methyl-D-erythritol kinase [Sphingomonadales bacterium]
MSLSETAYAKINLALHVRGRRGDGYHELETVFAFCEHGDEIIVQKDDLLSLEITGPFAKQLDGQDNIIAKAARLLSEICGAAVHLTKNLPVASGIGGGSADAAATLRLLSRLWTIDLPTLEAQRSLGADVPSCVLSQTMRGSGVGEYLIPETPVTGTPVLLINPGVALSTAAVFAQWDGTDRGPLGDWQSGRNDLEVAARTIVPEIGSVLDWMSGQRGVTIARMSGSGATCFALFETFAARDAAHAAVPSGYWAMASTLR